MGPLKGHRPQDRRFPVTIDALDLLLRHSRTGCAERHGVLRLTWAQSKEPREVAHAFSDHR